MKKKPKLKVEFVKETINFPEFIEGVLRYIESGGIPKKNKRELLKNNLKKTPPFQ